MSKNLFRGVDIERIAEGFEVENNADFIFTALAVLLFTEKLADWDRSVFGQPDILMLTPEPVTRGIRMFAYREEAIKWRLKHPMKAAAIIRAQADRDFWAQIKAVYDGANTLSSIIGFLK